MSLITNTIFTKLDDNVREYNRKALLLGKGLYQTNPIVQTLQVQAANAGWGNVSGIITSLGTSSYARVSKGIPNTKTSVLDQEDKVEILVRRITIPNLLAMGMKEKGAKLEQEVRTHRQGLNIDMTKDFLYGNPLTNIDQMLGLAQKMNSLTALTTVVGTYTGSGTGSSLTSAYIITNGFEDLYGVYPEPGEGAPNAAAWNSGVSYVIRGDQPITDPTSGSNTFYGEIHELMWGLAFTILNQRTQARLCNLPTSGLKVNPTIGTDLAIDDELGHTMMQMQNFNSGFRQVFMNRYILDYYTRQCKNRGNLLLNTMELEGFSNPFTTINGHNIQMVEQISNAETQVS